MISTLDNKAVTKYSHMTIIDGTLGGAGQGEVGDPATYLPVVWQAILDRWQPRTVIDVGCGFGYSTRWFENAGCVVLGLEGSRHIVKDAVTPAVLNHNFTEGKVRGDRTEWDFCWCSEFLEHVDDRYLPNVFDTLTRCRYVLAASALPGFRGHHHVNEQPPEYWIERFAAHGFRCDEEETDRLRKIAAESNPESYMRNNGLFFVRERVVEAAPHWTEIGGWMNPRQGEVLQCLAKGKNALELGTYHGRATICMAQVAKQITTIDHHRGEYGKPTLDTFRANVERFGLADKIEPIISDLDDLGNTLEDRRFEVVYIDSRHDAESVERDSVIALHAITPGGAIVWHDWDYPEVRAGVLATGLPMEAIQESEDMGVFISARYKVATVLPHSRTVEIDSVKSAIQSTVGRAADQVSFIEFPFGCLTHNFNTLLAMCLNMRDKGLVTHMAMIHSDVAADPGWVDILAEEMCLKRVAVISACVMIKDPDDDRTSTAIGVKGQEYEYGRYIRLRDEPFMPATFMTEDVCNEDGSEVLLINTGCMLIDLSWDFWETFVFQVKNRMLKDENGLRYAQFNPEDWLMSRELDAANIPYAATWRVKTRHIGSRNWENRPKEIGNGDVDTKRS